MAATTRLTFRLGTGSLGSWCWNSREEGGALDSARAAARRGDLEGEQRRGCVREEKWRGEGDVAQTPSLGQRVRRCTN